MNNEERIIYYENYSQIQGIVSKMNQEEFNLVENNSNKKQLFFKKFNSIPKTHFVEDF